MPIRKSLLLALAAVPILGLIDLMGSDGVYEKAAHGATAAASASSLPPYVRRGDEVEARYRAYSGRLEHFFETLAARVRESAPDVSPKLEAARPKGVLHGYQVMEVVADPDDIMGAPGTGPVLRRHFEKIIGNGTPPTSAGPADDGDSPGRD